MATVTVTAEAVIDPAEYLNDISTEDLIKEIETRGDHDTWDFEHSPLVAAAKQALDMLHGGRVRDAIELLEKTLYPKWYDEQSCREAYEEAIAPKKGKLPAYRGAGGHAHS